MIAFHGTYTALVTPFTADGSAVDVARLEANIRHQAAGRVTGIVPCGTTGESPTLSEAEHRAVVERTIGRARPLGLQVIAGAGSNNTAHAVHLHRLAHAAGADASLQVSPYYNKPSQEGLYRHFMTIADACDLPIMLYNIPGRTGVAISTATFERLAKHPNIQAVKEATGSLDSAGDIAARTNLTLLSGDDSLTLPMAALGATGVVSVVSNLVPDRVQTMCEALLADDWDGARRMHRELLPLSRGLLSLDVNPVPVKAALELLGRDTGALRLPLVRASDQTRESIRALLEAAGLTSEGKSSSVAAGARRE